MKICVVKCQMWPASEDAILDQRRATHTQLNVLTLQFLACFGVYHLTILPLHLQARRGFLCLPSDMSSSSKRLTR